MNDLSSSPQAGKAVKLSGTIANYRCVRASASFVYSLGDRDNMGVVAIAAVLAGMGGQAASVAGYSSDIDEPADYVEFNLNGKAIKGWAWHSPFKDGDFVHVAAEWRDSYYEAYGISRPADRTIALYPHCSRSKGRHIKNAIKWWAICSVIFCALMHAVAAYIGGMEFITDPSFRWTAGASTLVFVPMFISLSKQFMPFVRLSEKVFVVLGLPDAKNIDLVQSSKQQRIATDPAEFGTFYFRY
jgi:hypothetical protein